MKKIKICGLRRQEDIDYVNQYKPDYIGFVFAQSRRQVSLDCALKLKERLHKDIKSVGVFVNEEENHVIDAVRQGCIDYIQLHGDEDEEMILRLKKATQAPIIKAVRVQTIDDIYAADKLSCDYLLLDTYQKDAYGGTGKSFSWDMIPKEIKHPFFLAGGLSIDNIEKAYKLNAYGYDISGGVETDGMKDKEKIEELIHTFRMLEKIGG